MDASTLAKLNAARIQLEEELGFTRPLRDLADFAGGLDEVKKPTYTLILPDGKKGVGGLNRSSILNLAHGWLRSHGKITVRRDQDGKEWNFDKTFIKGNAMLKALREAKGAEQVACAASGALGLKRGQKGNKAKLAKEIAKRTKSKVLAAKAKKLAQEY